MKIHGIFSWYDESPAWIAAAIAGAARFCDHILAVDGAYALYPEGSPRSHPNQVEAILHTAEAQGVACTLYQPQEVWWGNEVEKRNKSLDLIGPLAEDGDWVCIFDADYHVLKCNPESIRHELTTTACDVATYGITEGEDWLSNGAESLAVQAKIKSQWVSQSRDLYRWNPTLRVGPAHGDYSIGGGIDVTGFGDTSPREFPARKWLRGPYDLQPAHDVSGFLTVWHRTKSRILVRRESQQGYYHMRDTLGVESPEGVTSG